MTSPPAAPPRLSEAALAGLPAEVERPRYDRRRVRAGVVHLGLGAFHRAHQAPVFEALLQAGHLDWGVVGVAMRSRETRDRLAPQDGLYTLVEREGEARRLTVCGALTDVLLAAEAPQRVIAALADPAVRLVTLTITEKGYEAGGPVWPLLAEAMARRQAAGAPLTLISCDNLTQNGAKTRAALLAASAPALADWIAGACAFPNAMVDRITPAPTQANLAEVAARLGVRDEAAVATEPFWQWVVEDRFAGEAPPLASAGVEVVDDVAPFERAKLRLLNGAHSTMAYAGLLCGFAFVHEAIAWPPLARLVERLWDEAETTLDAPPSLDVGLYRAKLLRRFANCALDHRLDQIAEDGSRKLSQRLLAPLAERTRAGAASSAMLFALACWLRCLEGRDDAGRPIRLVDPGLEVLRAALRRGADPFDAMAEAGMTPRRDWVGPEVRAELGRQCSLIDAQGARQALAAAASAL